MKQRYGRYRLIRAVSSTYWLMKCDCGTEKAVYKYELFNGNTKSCGCLKRDKLNAFNKVHGLSGTRPHRIWNGIMQRCFNPNRRVYKYYGGRGITCDPKWHTFAGFWEDMSGTYSDGLEIDRMDNDGNYCKENCRWVTHKDQVRNQPRTRKVEINGVTKTLREWISEMKLNFNTIESRIRRQGMTPKEALLKPVQRRKK